MKTDKLEMLFRFTHRTFRFGRLGNWACESNRLESRLSVVNLSSPFSDRRSLVSGVKENYTVQKPVCLCK